MSGHATGAAALLALASAMGCASPPAVRPAHAYPRAEGHEPLPATIDVAPFRDFRVKSDTYASTLAYIPFVPYATDVRRVPERWSRDGYRPLVHFPETLAAHLGRARVFGGVRWLGSGSGEGDGMYLLDGVIRSSRIEERRITYGVSFFATFLWFVGLPVGSRTVVLEADCRIVERASGRVVWREAFEVRDSTVRGLYYGRRTPRFFPLAADAAYRVVRSIDHAVAEGAFAGS